MLVKVDPADAFPHYNYACSQLGEPCPNATLNGTCAFTACTRRVQKNQTLRHVYQVTVSGEDLRAAPLNFVVRADSVPDALRTAQTMYYASFHDET